MNTRSLNTDYDLIVIGSGPAGQKAAVQAAKAGHKVALVERDRRIGGACVYRGTIPSKTLRENALRIQSLRAHSEWFNDSLREDIEMSSLVSNLKSVLSAHDKYIQDQLQRNGIDLLQGIGSFVSKEGLKVTRVGGNEEHYRAKYFLIATGSYPRHLPGIDVDHEHIYDSDSILSTIYLPRSLTVLGSGVIASEYASIFSALGVVVTMIDRFPTPLGFLDPELTAKFIHAFEADGGRFIGSSKIVSVQWDGISQVVTTLENGEQIKGDKLLVAAGRIANVRGLAIENAGLKLNEQGVLPVDQHCRSDASNIYAAGDVVGYPALASTSMEQGRRASCHMFGIEVSSASKIIPAGIFCIPEMSSIGIDEKQALEENGAVVVGRANFSEIARGQISGIQDGMLKMVADPEGKKMLGVQIIGEGATELIHIAQMGLLHNWEVDQYVENIFNFPTLAEAYRVAALQIAGQRP